MPTSIPLRAARERRIDLSIIALILLYVACVFVIVDSIVRGAAPSIEIDAAQADPGL